MKNTIVKTIIFKMLVSHEGMLMGMDASKSFTYEDSVKSLHERIDDCFLEPINDGELASCKLDVQRVGDYGAGEGNGYSSRIMLVCDVTEYGMKTCPFEDKSNDGVVEGLKGLTGGMTETDVVSDIDISVCDFKAAV